MGRLDGKIALVTGATSGIGQATAVMFAKEGAKVVASGSNEQRGADTLKRIKAAGGEGIFFKCNVRVADEIKALVKGAMDHYGRIDVLINAAGVLVHKPFLEHTMEDYKTISEVNFLAYVHTMQAVLPLMVANGKGAIVNVASVSVMKPELNSYFYGAFKAAINKLTIDVAKEFSPKGVRLNVLCPGPINTGMTPDYIKNSKEAQEALIKAVCPVGRLGEPDDIAYCAVYLASDESSFVTGSTFVVDGGVNISG